MTSIPAQSTSDNQSQSKLVPPHGSDTLKPLLLKGQAHADALKLASSLPTITLSSRARGDLIMLGIGGFTP
ncbi:sulfate adenylyltransferase, partial [Psychrobacter sp. T6-1]